MLKNKKGISLIVLIITIIVIIILATIIVMSFNNNNPIGKANEAKFKSDLTTFRDELLATHTDKSIADSDYVPEDVNVNVGNYNQMKVYIPDITEKYAKKLLIRRGKLLYISDETSSDYKEEEEEYAKEVGIKSPYRLIGDADGDGEITENDADYIRDYVAGKISNVSEMQRKAMDADGSGDISVYDATAIGEYLNGLIDHLPKN